MKRFITKIRKWQMILGGVFLAILVMIAAWFIFGSHASGLEFSHYERAGFDGAFAVLKFTNRNPCSVTFDMREYLIPDPWNNNRFYSPSYRLLKKESDKWVETKNGGRLSQFAAFSSTAGEALPGETITLKLPIPNNGTPYRLGFSYRPTKPRTLRSALFYLRGYLHKLGFGTALGNDAMLETAWCNQTLSAPQNGDAYRAATPAPVYYLYNPNAVAGFPRRKAVFGASISDVAINPRTEHFSVPDSHLPPGTQRISASMSYDLPSSTPAIQWDGTPGGNNASGVQSRQPK